MICPEDIEIWRPVPIPGYAENYDVSNYGRVRRSAPGKRTRVGRIFPGAPNKRGWVRVPLYVDGKVKVNFVHRLVLSAFVGPCPDGMEGCHNNGIGSDNYYLNLRWDTHAANTDDVRRHGTMPYGRKHPGARLTDAAVVEIRARHAVGQSQKSLAEMFGVNAGTVCNIVHGRKWKHLLQSGSECKTGGPSASR